LGSPGRDDRQDGTEPYRAPWDAGYPQNPVPSDDVKVAGAPIAEQPAYAYDTDATTAIPDQGGMEPPGGLEPPVEREFDHLRRRPRTRTKTIKIAAIAAAVVVAGGGTAAWAMTGGSSAPAKKAAGTAGASGQAQADAQAPAPLTDAQRKDAADKRRKELKKRASRAARRDARKPALFVKGTPPPTKKPTPAPGSAGDPIPAGAAQKIARAMLPSFGWSPSSQFGCLVNLWNRESHWNAHAGNASGAYGIPQALPGSKMSSAGPDWPNNATTQIKWGLGYIKNRYSSPCGAWAHSQSVGWY
jgi:hypothetical protein